MAQPASIKLILVGNFGVGKTALTKRFVDNAFSDAPSTDTTDQYTKDVKLGGRDLQLKLGDTAGGEKFRTLTSSYFRNADVVLLVFDLTNQESADDIENSHKEANYYAPSAIKVLVGNKADLPRVITREAAVALAKKEDLVYYETSAKTGDGVEKMFLDLARKSAGISDEPPASPPPAPVSKQASKGSAKSSSNVNSGGGGSSGSMVGGGGGGGGGEKKKGSCMLL